MARPATAFSCTGRIVLVRRDRDAGGRVVESKLLAAWHSSEIDVEEIRRTLPAAAAKAQPVAGAVAVEVEVVEL